MTAIAVFEGKEIRAIEKDGDVWIPVVDITKAWGISRSTLPDIINRNERLFQGYHVLASVTPSSPDEPESKLICVNEQGLYLLMGRLNSDRVKDPYAAETILKFQRWVPELLKAFRKGDVRLSKELEAVVRSHLNIADAMVEFAHVDRGIMTTVALARVESETGADLSWLKGLVRKDRAQPPGYLNATQIGQEFAMSNKTINQLLAQLGFQYWAISQWQPTNIGRGYGENLPFTVINPNGSSHSGYQWKWNPDVVRILREQIFSTDQARLGVT